jgi:hypothetical protein
MVAGRSRPQADRPHAVSGQPMLIYTCHAHAALCRGIEKSVSERYGRGMAWERHGICELAFIFPFCFTYFSYRDKWISVVTIWGLLSLRMEETVCRYGRQLRIFLITCRCEPTGGGLRAAGLGGLLKVPYHKNVILYETIYIAAE